MASQAKLDELAKENERLSNIVSAKDNLDPPGSSDAGGGVEIPVADNVEPRVDQHYRTPKLQPFYKADPALWFFRCDAAFRNAKITRSESKVDYVIEMCGNDVVTSIADILRLEVCPDRYERIKDRLIQSFGSSSETKLRQLLRNQVLTDGKPSQILARLQSLNESGCDDSVIRTLFLEHLPQQCKLVLAVSEITDLQKLASVANKLMEVAPSVSNSSSFAVTAAAKEPESDNTMTSLLTALKALNCNVEKLSKKVDRRLRSRERSASRSRSPSRSGRKRNVPKPAHLKLRAANNTLIDTFGDSHLVLDLGLRRHISWNFCVASVPTAVIGADILSQFGLVIDLKHKRLIDPLSDISVPGSVRPSPMLSLSVVKSFSHSRYSDILAAFPELFRTAPVAPLEVRDVLHHIVTSGPPVSERPRRLSPDKLKVAKAEFKQMCEAGICQPSSSPWASPIHMVPKADGSWRICGDYRRLNAVTIPDRYPPPRLQDFAANLHGATVFSTLDLHAAYYEIPVAPEDVPKTAVTTPFGLFEFLVMTPGLRNAGQTFQRRMDQAFSGLDFVFVFFDDVLVASSSPEQHEEHLRIVCDRLKRFHTYSLVN
ncbi:PREDICTED: uncharacterized protein LOC105556647 [Vollenhovia emeryi]|uniref:uncharacterized protein LOC105556647 n=1 Tax=Vollenhovia emeryi TaxID=411798 RepID=UPI0005F3BA96|nr:PREDICTED: uncharacterized protein LOC105556647 [Vollenhovia emeryi]